MQDYKACYEKNHHKLLKIKLGLPVTHDPASNESIVWKKISISLLDDDWDVSCKKIDTHARNSARPILDKKMPPEESLQSQVYLLTQQVERLKVQLAAAGRSSTLSNTDTFTSPPKLPLPKYSPSSFGQFNEPSSDSLHARLDKQAETHAYWPLGSRSSVPVNSHGIAPTSANVSYGNLESRSMEPRTISTRNEHCSRKGVQELFPVTQNTQASSSMLSNFEHPLLSLHMSSIQAPSDILPVSPRMMLDELEPPEGQYVLFGHRSISSHTSRPEITHAGTPMPNEFSQHQSSGTRSDASTPKRPAIHYRSQEDVMLDDRYQSTNTILYPGSLLHEDISRNPPLPSSPVDDTHAIESYDGLLRKVEQALNIEDSAPPHLSGVLKSKSPDEQINTGTHHTDIDATDSIDSMLNQIQHVLSTDIYTSTRAHPSACSATRPTSRNIQEPPIISKPHSNAIHPTYYLPSIEYNSLVEEDSLLERASDPIMRRYLGSECFLPHHKKVEPQQGIPTRDSTHRYDSSNFGRHRMSNFAHNEQVTSVPLTNDSICDAHTSDFENQSFVASLNYLHRRPLNNQSTSDQETTQVLNLAHIHSLPKLR
ncbi:hypothetical protein BSLG_007679 [Batrachochytrium salamandrivorans]|nr:hypothetical protein BSLG_007679 [Batrachochytrium salamandrivorans]